MAILLKNLEFHPKILDNGINESEEFGEGDEKFSLNISMPSPFSGMPENYFDWPEAKIVSRYWTKECIDELAKEIKNADFKVLGNSFDKRMKSIIGEQEYKTMLGELKSAKEKFEAEGLWIHGYTTPPIYFAEAVAGVLKSGGDLEYISKSDARPLDLTSVSNSQHDNIRRMINISLPDVENLKSMKQCIACGSDKLLIGEEQGGFLLLSKYETMFCTACGTKFRKRTEGDNKWQLRETKANNSTMWAEYRLQELYPREWVDVANKVADIERWLEKLSNGSIKISFKGVDTPVIMKPGEDLLFALPAVTLKEPRAVRKSSGGYAGPSFRIAKGVYFRMGRFGSTSESHQEICDIDKGILTITNERFVFSGNMKTINLDLRKIVQVDPFTDGLALHKEGREKTQYFVWNENIGRMQLSEGERSYSEPINGMIMKCVMEGAIRNFNKSRR
ncbi:hypothetical protein KGQ34_02760 [Patescibacteria group bacterium]|nr:hypothetical protein [Patescibacteria group bacterium]